MIFVRDIAQAVAEHYGTDIMQRSLKREVSRPRQAAMFLSTRLTAQSLPDIGKRFGRHHTTVLEARRRIEALSQVDEGLHKDLLDITRQIFSEEHA